LNLIGEVTKSVEDLSKRVSDEGKERKRVTTDYLNRLQYMNDDRHRQTHRALRNISEKQDVSMQALSAISKALIDQGQRTEKEEKRRDIIRAKHTRVLEHLAAQQQKIQEINEDSAAQHQQQLQQKLQDISEDYELLSDQIGERIEMAQQYRDPSETNWGLYTAVFAGGVFAGVAANQTKRLARSFA
jgi:hypothetical protein